VRAQLPPAEIFWPLFSRTLLVCARSQGSSDCSSTRQTTTHGVNGMTGDTVKECLGQFGVDLTSLSACSNVGDEWNVIKKAYFKTMCVCVGVRALRGTTCTKRVV